MIWSSKKFQMLMSKLTRCLVLVCNMRGYVWNYLVTPNGRHPFRQMSSIDASFRAAMSVIPSSVPSSLRDEGRGSSPGGLALDCL